MERRAKALVSHDRTQVINRDVVRATLHGKEMLCLGAHTRRHTHTHSNTYKVFYTDTVMTIM